MAPSDRRRPISLRLSRTEMIIVFATPMPPTSRAIEPTPTSSAVKVWSAAFFAARASEGRETLTEVGFFGLSVGPRRARTSSTLSSVERS